MEYNGRRLSTLETNDIKFVVNKHGSNIHAMGFNESFQFLNAILDTSPERVENGKPNHPQLSVEVIDLFDDLGKTLLIKFPKKIYFAQYISSLNYEVRAIVFKGETR